MKTSLILDITILVRFLFGNRETNKKRFFGKCTTILLGLERGGISTTTRGGKRGIRERANPVNFG